MLFFYIPRRSVSYKEQSVLKDLTIRIFWAALMIHVTAWTVMCWLTQPNLPLDMVEMTYWGEQWQWGYHKHPPLPAWIAASVWELSAHQPIAMYLCAQLTIAATFWAVWQLAREGLEPWLALCAVGALQACYYCTYTISDLNNTIVARPFWALAILFLYRATKPQTSKTLLWWSLTGVMVGLGMLSKYSLGLMVISMAAIPILLPHARAQLKTVGPWCMTVIALGIFSPHIYWMFQNDFVTLEYVVQRSNASDGHSWLSHLLSPLKFLISQTGAWLPILLVALPLLSLPSIRQSMSAIRKGSGQSYFRSYLLIVVGVPILFCFCAAAITGANIRSMWGGSLFSFWGLLLIELSKDACGEFRRSETVKIVLRNSCIAATVMLLGLFIRNGLGPLMRDDFSRIHFPGQALCEEVHRRWEQRVDTPLPVIGGAMFPAGCAVVYSDRRIDVFSDASEKQNPWLNDATVAQSGAVFVWEIEELGAAPPADWLRRFPRAQLMEPFVCSAEGLAADRNAEVGMVFIPPENLKLRTAETPSLRQTKKF